MLSRAITPKRRGRRPLTALAIITVVAGLALSAGSVLAVHDLAFQLDGDTTPIAQNNPNVPDPAPGEDWETLFNADGTPTDIDTDATTGFNDGAFTRDFRAKASKNATPNCTGHEAFPPRGRSSARTTSQRSPPAPRTRWTSPVGSATGTTTSTARSTS